MADWFLILATVVTLVILLVVALYFLVHYQHPDDKNDAWFPKLTVILGFVLAGATVLLLPLDVANNEGYSGCDGYDTRVCGGLNMELFWSILYWAIPIWVFILIPFMTFYYEADDGMLMAGTAIGAKPNSRIREALCYELAVIIVIGLLFGLCYIFLNDSAIPVREYTGSKEGAGIFTTAQGDPFQISQFAEMSIADTRYINSVVTNSTLAEITIPVSISNFFAGLMAFIGWFFFALFGGIGLASTPLDLILTYTNRPRHMGAAEFAEAQISIRERVNEMVEIGEMMKIEQDEKRQAGGNEKGMFNRFSKEAREEQKKILEFKKAVYLLETDVEDFQNCSANYASYNPLIPYIALLFGILSILLSILWLVQISIYVLPADPIHPFLNWYFQWFDRWFPLFGVLSVAFFSLYLYLCAINGCFKFGLRFLFFQLHPMKVNKTYMSSFMFNIGLILLCALPVVQFSTTAFADYARYTNVYQVMATQVEYLKFFRWFWTKNIFVIAMLSVTGLTAFYLVCKPKDTSKSSTELRDRLKSRRA